MNEKDYSIENISFTFQDITFDMKTVGSQDFLSKLTSILLDNTGELNRQNGSKKVIMITDSYMKIKKFITWIQNMDSMSERHFEATVIGKILKKIYKKIFLLLCIFLKYFIYHNFITINASNIFLISV